MKVCQDSEEYLREDFFMANEGVRSSVAVNVTRLRELRRWSKAHLAREATRYYTGKVDPSHITRIENGEFENPRPPMLRALAQALNCEMEELTGRESLRRVTPYESNPRYRSLIDALEEVGEAHREEFLNHAMWLVEILRAAAETDTDTEHDRRRGSATIAPSPAPHVPPGSLWVSVPTSARKTSSKGKRKTNV